MNPQKLQSIFRSESGGISAPSSKSKFRRKLHVKNGESPGRTDPLQFLNRKRNLFLTKSKSPKVENRNIRQKLQNANKSSIHDETKFSLEQQPTKNYSQRGAMMSKKPQVSNKSQEKTPAKTDDPMVDHLKGSQFRFLNELLYTQSSEEAAEMFREDPEAFYIYHSGYESQRSRWPKDPLQRVMKFLRLLPKEKIVADFGCGDARLAATLSDRKIHSFDFLPLNERVTACDMRRTPLKRQSVDVAVFCLSLMGTNCNEFILEANRVLKNKGILKIVEISSRIQRLTRLVNQIEKMGFKCIDKASEEMFIYLTFMKQSDCQRGNLPLIILNACPYKKR